MKTAREVLEETMRQEGIKIGFTPEGLALTLRAMENYLQSNLPKADVVADVMRSANCYNELKAFLQEKKKSPRLCAWDSVHHQEIWDKMLELEQKYSEHYA